MNTRMALMDHIEAQPENVEVVNASSKPDWKAKQAEAEAQKQAKIDAAMQKRM